jgi:uracil phosphoribosyltransferase
MNLNRVINLVIEEAFSQFPHEMHSISTRNNSEFKGNQRNVKICGVSILPDGVAMDNVLRRHIRLFPLRRIRRNRKDAKIRLPPNVEHVLLMDPMLETGESVICAVESLLEKGVPLENIVSVNMISCPEGIREVFQRFPGLKMVTGFIDQELNDDKKILPGLGDFKDLYFGQGFCFCLFR